MGDPSATAVERFLKWEPDPVRRSVALACALPRRLDADVFRAVVECEEGEADALYDWLGGMPFVSERGDRVQYHEVVRAPMLRLQRRRSPRGWAERHGRLAEVFGRWRSERRAGLSDPWADERWRELRLAEAYHRVCAGEGAALQLVLGIVVRACQCGGEEARRWATMLVEAGADTQAEAVSRWGRDLLHALQTSAAANALALLIERATLDTATRALAHALRGNVFRVAEEHERAIADYDGAIALDAGLARAHHGRGVARAGLGDYEGAVADLDRALALDPDNAARHLAARGDYHRLCKRYETALRDLARAIELDPTLRSAWASRGAVHRTTGHHDLALADLNRALEIDPDFVWALVVRARIRRSRGERELQLADLDRAVTLAPEAPWVLCERGDALSAADREEEALADYRKAIELKPGYASAYASRGALHGKHGRDEEALADLDHALDLVPDYAWALVHRSKAHRHRRAYNKALADAYRAAELGPVGAWVLANKIETDLGVGRLERARSDLERYHSLDGDTEWARRQSVTVHLLSGRLGEALAEADTAATRCAVHLRMRNWRLAKTGRAWTHGSTVGSPDTTSWRPWPTVSASSCTAPAPTGPGSHPAWRGRSRPVTRCGRATRSERRSPGTRSRWCR
ncbi:tetratricopeptide repeat protein [Streptomyces sp. NPDC053086]|uniref:tetratricopeptide repeat protein n=1 Tax=unclassified Streptomyces TaxID=2593676 RepID=UPI0037D8D934